MHPVRTALKSSGSQDKTGQAPEQPSAVLVGDDPSVTGEYQHGIPGRIGHEDERRRTKRGEAFETEGRGPLECTPQATPYPPVAGLAADGEFHLHRAHLPTRGYRGFKNAAVVRQGHARPFGKNKVGGACARDGEKANGQKQGAEVPHGG